MCHHTVLYLAAKRLPTCIAMSEGFQSKIWQGAVVGKKKILRKSWGRDVSEINKDGDTVLSL